VASLFSFQNIFDQVFIGSEQTVSQVFERRSQASVERQKSFEEEWKHKIMDFSKRLMVYERKRKG